MHTVSHFSRDPSDLRSAVHRGEKILAHKTEPRGQHLHVDGPESTLYESHVLFLKTRSSKQVGKERTYPWHVLNSPFSQVVLFFDSFQCIFVTRARYWLTSTREVWAMHKASSENIIKCPKSFQTSDEWNAYKCTSIRHADEASPVTGTVTG